ncbi:hypothetical protein QYF36_012573 [Acer negundo]|nr:hypothetical protein QYF36_012573 [Acer negundo]
MLICDGDYLGGCYGFTGHYRWARSCCRKKEIYTLVGSGRGRHSFERERFRNDNSRQHGNGGGRGYGRNEYGNWGKFSGQGWGSTRRGDDYQRGKGGSSGGPKQKAVISA